MFDHKKVMMVLPERLGDTLLATPAIHYLKSHCPTMIIDVIALSDLAADTIKNNPDIQHVYVLPSQKFLKKIAGSYDVGINIHDGKLARNYFNMLKIQVHHPLPADQNMHHAEQALLFAQSLLPHHPPITERRYRLFTTPEDIAYVEHMLVTQDQHFQNHVLIGCQIGCHSVAKRGYKIWRKPTHPKVWPLEYIIELANKLSKINPHIRLVITGSKSEKKLGKEVERNAPNIINMIDKTTVPQLKALMNHLKMFISPDTGLLHVACSCDIPLIALFGPTNIKRTAPYPELSNLTLLRAETLHEISVEQVLKAVLRNLQQNSDNSVTVKL